MNKILTTLCVLLIASTGFAQVKSNITHSSVTFQIKNMGINTGGSLSGLQANIQFTPTDLQASKIVASVDVNTINTGNDEKDTHLKTADFFEVARYPKITLSSTSFKHKSGNNYVGTFNLTIKAKTKSVELPFTYTETAGTGAFKGSIKINRLDFGVGDSSIILSNDLTVNIEVYREL